MYATALLLKYQDVMEASKKCPLLEFNINVKEDLKKLYNLNNGRMEQSVDILEEWVKKQTHFVNKNLSRKHLESSLMRCKGSVEKVKSQIEKLCTFKTLLPEYFISDLKPVYIQMDGMINMVPLPKMTKQHDRIFYIQSRFNDRPFTLSHLKCGIQCSIAISEYLLHTDCPSSYIVIIDLRDADLKQLVKSISLTYLRHTVIIIKKGYGSRLSAVHFLSPSNLIDIFLNTILPIMSGKLAARVRCHATVEDLCTVLDRNMLPTSLGGKQGCIDNLNDKWKELLCSEEVKVFLAEKIASCTDESLRQKDTFNEDIMGIPGSFRSLSVD